MKIQDRVLQASDDTDFITLRTICPIVEDNEMDLLPAIKDDMLKILESSNARGLAAPQVGLLKRILILKTNMMQNILFMANPNIVKSSSMCLYYKEGCLSLPDIRVTTNRSRQVTVEYFDENGTVQVKRLGGIDAVCVQHEIDHLNGILMTARGR